MKGAAHTDGIDDVISAVHALDEAKKARDELATALADAEARVAQAHLRLQQIVTHGRCVDDCPPAPVNGGTRPAASGAPSNTQLILEDRNTAICWRIAMVLAENPVLDYQSTAEILWGPDLDKHVAKNRVNAQLTRLKKLDVIRTLGSNRYEVNRARLAELSGLPVPGEAAP